MSKTDKNVKKSVKMPKVGDNNSKSKNKSGNGKTNVVVEEIQTEVENFPGVSDEELASRVWNGEFGTGDERRAALGDRYDAVQNLVNGGIVTTVEEAPVSESVQNNNDVSEVEPVINEIDAPIEAPVEEVPQDTPAEDVPNVETNVESSDIGTISSPELDVNSEIKDKIQTGVPNDLLDPALERASKYNNGNPNFQVTTGNQTYNLSDVEVHLLKSVVAAEAANSPDDALAVTSVILNRADANYSGVGVITQVTASGQFSAYGNGGYLKFYNSSVSIPESVNTAVDDALLGIRNNSYLHFNGKNASSDEFPYQVAAGGNKYKW